MASKTGKFLGVPYDWRRPTWERTTAGFWKPDDPRLLIPRSFGWGYNINFARVVFYFKKLVSRAGSSLKKSGE